MRYRPVYECALCKARNYCEVSADMGKDQAKYWASHPNFQTEVLHECDDGSIGIAPFIGFKMEVEEEDSAEND